MMTRQHFRLIAAAIRELRNDLPTDDMTDHGMDIVAQALASSLAHTNAAFDRARFLEACGC